MSMKRFYDTCSLLEAQESAFQSDDIFFISNTTLTELENIKSSGYKDEETKFKANNVSRLLDKNPDKYKIIYHRFWYNKFWLPKCPDKSILECAYHIGKRKKDFIFYSEDKQLRNLARTLKLNTSPINLSKEDEYTGFKVVDMTDDELAEFYENYKKPNVKNKYGLIDNQYLIIKNNNEYVDKYKWLADGYVEVRFVNAESRTFGKITPKDVFQECALDSLSSNEITFLGGPAGSGKSTLSMGYLFHKLEKGKISKIVIFCNTIAAKGAAKLGFYPGDKDEKLLDSQIGNFLISKIGDRSYVEKMIDDGLLVLVPMADIRGYDTSGMNAGIYITEAQNLDKELMKLALQRIGDDSICILDGDYKAQVDLAMYAGANNGLRRASQVFKGHDVYGQINLQKIYRSKIAEIAEKM